jgi:hypothetical protein
MALLNRILGLISGRYRQQSASDIEPKQAVIVHFRYGIKGLQALHDLEHKLEQIINESAAGEYEGHEIATDYSDGFLYMYADNAERLFQIVEPTLKQADFMRGAIATIRSGPPEDGVRKVEVE